MFEVAASQRPGKVAERHRLSRGQFSGILVEQAPETVVMEACGTAHSWGREAGAIRKRGDPYLRMLLLHSARSVLLHAKKATGERDRRRTWALDRERPRGHDKAAVALANKLARVAGAVWRRERAFGASPPKGKP